MQYQTLMNSKWKTLQNSYPIITPKGVALEDPNPK